MSTIRVFLPRLEGDQKPRHIDFKDATAKVAQNGRLSVSVGDLIVGFFSDRSFTHYTIEEKKK